MNASFLVQQLKNASVRFSPGNLINESISLLEKYLEAISIKSEFGKIYSISTPSDTFGIKPIKTKFSEWETLNFIFLGLITSGNSGLPYSLKLKSIDE